MRWCGLVAVVVFSLAVHEPRAAACTPPAPPDADARVAPWLARSVFPSTGTVVPTNVVVRVAYRFKYFGDESPIGVFRARLVGGAEIPVEATLVLARDDTDPFQWDPLVAKNRMYEIRLPGLAAGSMFELLDAFDASCDPCVEHEPAPFATFTAGAGPDTQPPVLDPQSGILASEGYHEIDDTCTHLTCKGSFAAWSWAPATDDGGAVWYHVTYGDSMLRAWQAEPTVQNAVAICQDCENSGPSIYWNRFALRIGMTVRAVDRAGNLSAAAVVISVLPPCGFPPDAGPPMPDAPVAAPPAPDAPSAPASSPATGSGCSVSGSPRSALPWGLALLLAAYRRRARSR